MDSSVDRRRGEIANLANQRKTCDSRPSIEKEIPVNDIRQCGLNYDRQRVHELLPEDPSFKMVGDTGIEDLLHVKQALLPVKTTNYRCVTQM